VKNCDKIQEDDKGKAYVMYGEEEICIVGFGGET
jgi:hypothetical protein